MLHKTRLLTPGPTPLPEAVRLAMAQDMVHHRKAAFKATLANVAEQLKILFDTATPVLPLSCSGTGAMVAAVGNLFAPGEAVLTIEAGKFGERWGEIARQRGLSVDTLEFDWGQPADVDRVAEALRAKPYAGLLVQVSETSTGVLHPVRQLAQLTAGTDTLLVADGISAVGVSPCPMDDWGIDCLVTGSQKGLMLPPGLALLACSEKAWAKAETVAPETFYFDLKNERANAEKSQTRFTSPVGLLVGLEVALELLLTDGLEAIYRKQWALTRMARAGAATLGLDFLAPEAFTWGLTSVKLPESPRPVDGIALLEHAATEHGVILAGGQAQLKGRIVRLGHMGWVDYGDVAAGLFALADGLAAQGHTVPPDYLVQALAAYRAGLREPLPEL